MAVERNPAVDPRWREYGADQWADAVVVAMKLGGVKNLFFVSGSELGFYQEAVAKAREREWPAPRLVTVTHEGVALNAALGNAMVTGQPAATAVHVDAGTFHYGARPAHCMAKVVSRADHRRDGTAGLPWVHDRRSEHRRPVGAGAPRPGRNRAAVHRAGPPHGTPGQPWAHGESAAAGGHERTKGAVISDAPQRDGHAANARHHTFPYTGRAWPGPPGGLRNG